MLFAKNKIEALASERKAVMATIYLIDMYGRPLMPCHNGALIRKLHREGKTKLISGTPYIVQLLVPVQNEYIQPYTLGIDAGYRHVGFSAVNEAGEAFSAELDMDPEAGKTNKNTNSERICEKRKYRRTRRNRLRYRKARFNNRRASKRPGWIPPSLKRKTDTHVRMTERIMSFLPVGKVIIEAGQFDQALIKAEAEGIAVDYQNGEQKGSYNTRLYVFARDGYECQNPDCPDKNLSADKKQKIRLCQHHLGYWKNDRSNRPSNLITLCEKCHTQVNHQPGHFLYGWEPALKSLKEPAMMNLTKRYIAQALADRHPDVGVDITYGYITRTVRVSLGIEKTHHDDAFCIAGVVTDNRADRTYMYKQHRRNNRSLETFKDAKYVDARDGSTKTGKELSSGRTRRNKNLSAKNLRPYRQQKTRKGVRSVRRSHYQYQPNDLVKKDGRTYPVVGVHSYGKQIKYRDGDEVRSTTITKVRPHKYNRGAFVAEIISKA